MHIRPTTLVLAVFVAAAAACGPAAADPTPPPGENEPTGTPSSTGGDPDGGTKPPPAPPVDGVPDEDELTEDFGVFVAKSGGDGADGSRAKPFPTIAAGLARAKEVGKRLYVCAEKFDEAVTVSNGIPMVGGFDCSSAVWKNGTSRTTIASPSSPALTAVDIQDPTRVEGFDVLAPDGTAESPSSIGLLARNAPGLTIGGGKIVAGRGADGAAGVEGVPLTFSQVSAATAGASDWKQSDTSIGGKPARIGGAGQKATCAGGPAITVGIGGTGGLGGSAKAEYCVDSPFALCGKPRPLVWAPTTPTSSPGGDGGGAPATNGNDGTSASSPGTVSADGFVPADGLAGTSGTAGQGGRGGGGASVPSRTPNSDGESGQGAMGPGGGAGGCPGLAGTPGKGGGASVAALVSASAGLKFDAVELLAGPGGKGGRGTLGSSATAGGAAATANPGGLAAQAGQAGGRAGVSGSGAGGSSIGLAHDGAAPELVNGAVAKAGQAGAGVAGDQVVDGAGHAKTLPASADGESKDVLAF